MTIAPIARAALFALAAVLPATDLDAQRDIKDKALEISFGTPKMQKEQATDTFLILFKNNGVGNVNAAKTNPDPWTIKINVTGTLQVDENGEPVRVNGKRQWNYTSAYDKSMQFYCQLMKMATKAGDPVTILGPNGTRIPDPYCGGTGTGTLFEIIDVDSIQRPVPSTAKVEFRVSYNWVRVQIQAADKSREGNVIRPVKPAPPMTAEAGTPAWYVTLMVDQEALENGGYEIYPDTYIALGNSKHIITLMTMSYSTAPDIVAQLQDQLAYHGVLATLESPYTIRILADPLENEEDDQFLLIDGDDPRFYWHFVTSRFVQDD